ncbi:YrhK family protein [Microbacterium sp. ARD31]|uniref:YrhK family protein n=1 Tax=Microbacterium sp. ARD31 TaxID=2962576 RepID=UPI002880CBA7|nr:YrhK family protein [Microbacterium sp. ARD31]MDT0182070.1 YrhK family protein [Microbacterium sp. ARD31]
MPSPQSNDGRTLELPVGRDEIVVRHVYEVVSIVNDVMVALWFVVGSILFFSEDTTTAGTWLFLLGSIQLLIRLAIRLTRHVHVRRFGRDGVHDSAADY